VAGAGEVAREQAREHVHVYIVEWVLIFPDGMIPPAVRAWFVADMTPAWSGLGRPKAGLGISRPTCTHECKRVVE
jgi:hypothetical protein